MNHVFSFISSAKTEDYPRFVLYSFFKNKIKNGRGCVEKIKLLKK
jgi:hypothetical protein